MSADDIKDEALSVLRSRLSHPFLFAFILSWLVFNWDFFAYLILSDEAAAPRIHTLQHIYSGMEKMLWFPLSAAAVYVLLAPILKTLIDIYNVLLASVTRRTELIQGLKLADAERKLLKLEALSSQYKLWQEMRTKAREEVRAAAQEIGGYVTDCRSAAANLQETRQAINDALDSMPEVKRSRLRQAMAILDGLVERCNSIEKSSFKLSDIAKEFDSFTTSARQETVYIPRAD